MLVGAQRVPRRGERPPPLGAEGLDLVPFVIPRHGLSVQGSGPARIRGVRFPGCTELRMRRSAAGGVMRSQPIGGDSMAKSTRKLRPQPWDWPHPRVLLELPEGDGNGDRIAALRGAGYSVAVCPGPRDGSHCPLAGDDGCAVADEADIVVSSLGLHRPVARETLAALRKRLPEL